MSHLPERKEKDCLNCGAVIYGRYCHICGQENIEPKESFWHLVTHFVYDVTHFDGKFFSTLKYLLFKPGFLSKEYLRGRRMSYLHPIRMYVFTSAFFFLVFFSLKKDEDVVQMNDKRYTAAQQMKRLEKIKKRNLDQIRDSAMPEIAKQAFRSVVATADSDIAHLQRDSSWKDSLRTFGSSNNINIFGGGKSDSMYTSEHAYDSIQSQLPEDKKDNFLRRRFARQNIHLREKYKNDNAAFWKALLEKFKHLFPQMLFVSLPLFALMLQLLYIRRKQFYYVNHIMFTIHLYCGTFIIILAGIFIDLVLHWFDVRTQWTGGLFTLAGFFYWYKSLRNFYGQRRGKTIAKYLLVLFLSLIIMSLIFTIFFIFSAMTI